MDCLAPELIPTPLFVAALPNACVMQVRDDLRRVAVRVSPIGAFMCSR
jgi:hypothetical protein